MGTIHEIVSIDELRTQLEATNKAAIIQTDKYLNMKKEVESIHEKHNEILMAVNNKYEGETRHETALRYIQERENTTEQVTQEGQTANHAAKLEKEIESLRSECKRLIHEAAYMQQCRDSEKRQKEEWNRRCQSVLQIWKEHFPLTALWKRHGDAAKWFEEE